MGVEDSGSAALSRDVTIDFDQHLGLEACEGKMAVNSSDIGKVSLRVEFTPKLSAKPRRSVEVGPLYVDISLVPNNEKIIMIENIINLFHDYSPDMPDAEYTNLLNRAKTVLELSNDDLRRALKASQRYVELWLNGTVAPSNKLSETHFRLLTSVARRKLNILQKSARQLTF